jgi:hypothetical protein
VILAVLFSIALVAFAAWWWPRQYRKGRADRTAWLEYDRQVRRERGEDV